MNKLLDFNCKKSWAITRLNLRALRKTILLCMIPAGLMLLNFIVQYVFLTRAFKVMEIEYADYMGNADMLLLIPVMCAIFLASTNFFKTMRLNAKKKDYFLSCLITVAIIACAVALVMTFSYYAFEKPLSNNAGKNIFSISLFYVFGFADSFFLVGFLQAFGFVFFWSMFVFILTSLQDNIIGWLLDMAIAACVSVFSSIAFFRNNFWKPFFTATIFGHPALQICFTVFVGLALYSLYLLIVRRKKI